MEVLPKRVVVPVDASDVSFKTLDYLKLVFGLEHPLEVVLMYVLSGVPGSFLSMEQTGELRKKHKEMEKKAMQKGQEVLDRAKKHALDLGFKDEMVSTDMRFKRETVYKEICRLAGSLKVDSVAVHRKGKSWIEAFYVGEISAELIESCQHHPVWILDGDITSNRVLVCLDHSPNSLRAVDHAAFMLAGTGNPITLFHSIWHAGRFLTDDVLACAPDFCEAWDTIEESEVEPMFAAAKGMLLEAGVSEDRIAIEVNKDSRDPASDIVKKVKKGDYGTVVMGRRGISRVKEFFAGSITKKVFKKAENLAIWVVH